MKHHVASHAMGAARHCLDFGPPFESRMFFSGLHKTCFLINRYPRADVFGPRILDILLQLFSNLWWIAYIAYGYIYIYIWIVYSILFNALILYGIYGESWGCGSRRFIRSCLEQGVWSQQEIIRNQPMTRWGQLKNWLCSRFVVSYKVWLGWLCEHYFWSLAALPGSSWPGRVLQSKHFPIMQRWSGSWLQMSGEVDIWLHL